MLRTQFTTKIRNREEGISPEQFILKASQSTLQKIQTALQNLQEGYYNYMKSSLDDE